MIRALNAAQVAYHRKLMANMSSYIGLTEVTGTKDHPWIVLSHTVTKIVSPHTRAKSVDEIPWCASGTNLIMLETNFQLNPKATVAQLKRRGMPDTIIRMIQDYAEVRDSEIRDTGVKIPEPTWSAAASSFFTTGVEVHPDAWMPGLLLGMSRTGGNHITLWLKTNTLTFTCVGPNQSNMICSADTYLRSRFKHMRAVAL